MSLTLAEAADYLHLHPQTVRYHLKESGRIKGTRTADGWCFEKKELDAFARTVSHCGRQPKFGTSSAMSPEARAREALKLRERGWSLERIRVKLGYSDVSSVSRVLRRARLE